MRRTLLIIIAVAAVLACACRRDATTEPATDVVALTAQAFAQDNFAEAENLCNGLLGRTQQDAATPSQLCTLALDALKYYERSGNDVAVSVAVRLFDSAIECNVDSVADYICSLPVEDMAKLQALLQISHTINLPDDFVYPDEPEI